MGSDWLVIHTLSKRQYFSERAGQLTYDGNFDKGLPPALVRYRYGDSRLAIMSEDRYV